MTIHNDDYIAIASSVESLFLGNKIGQGSARRVYEHAFNDDYVIKIETNGHSFQNQREFDIWNVVEHTTHSKYFAPCYQISADGCALIMRRCDPLPKSYNLPKRMPEYFSDFKRSNWGLLNGKLVAIDYGSSIMTTTGLTSKIKTVDYWVED